MKPPTLTSPTLELSCAAARGTPGSPFPSRQPTTPNRRSCPTFIAGLLLLSTINSPLSTAFAQGTTFTYQGQLQNSGSPANGLYDFQFSLSNAPSGGSQVGSTVTELAVGVTNGLFTTTLDFGSRFTGNPTWLAISVCTNGTGSYLGLSPLQPLTPTPYAIYSANATTAATANSVSAANIVGTIPAAQLPLSVLTNGASGVNLSGTLTGNGAGVTNLPFGSLSDSGYISWGNFQLSSAPAAGVNPFFVCAADVNGDGHIDLICANYTAAGTLTVLTNNGFGSFGSNATLDVGIQPDFICAVDVNGDGKVDLISVNWDGTLTVLTNNGFGVFGSNATLQVGQAPRSVCAVDVIGDGKVDLISANESNGTLTVLTNNGFGIFGLNATLNVGLNSDPISVCAADVNGDGYLDLIVGNYGANTLTVLTNNGFGAFGFNATLNVGSGPGWACAADVNGDGHADLISANVNDNTLTVLTNNGYGVFGSNATLNVGAYPFYVIAADLKGDGHVDLVSANYKANTLTVLTNNGYGVFGSNTTLNVGNGPKCVCAADVNGDGQLDLVSANYGANTLTVWLNEPAYIGTFSGNGSGLTSLNATNLTGSVPASSLTSLPAGKLTGSVPAAALTSVPAASLTGTIPPSLLTSLPAANLTGSIPAGSLTAVPAGSLTGLIAQSSLGAVNAYAPTIGDGAINFTLTTQSGYYAKVGNLVYFEVWLAWNGRAGATSTSGVQISLPLPAATPRASFTVGFMSGLSFSTQLVAVTSGGLSYFNLFDLSKSGGAATAIPVSSCGASGEVQISGVYRWQ